MGFWRDIGSSLGYCDEYSRTEREEFRKDRASKLTRHERGCTCHWCKCASDKSPTER